jgi:hypothetical protein
MHYFRFKKRYQPTPKLSVVADQIDLSEASRRRTQEALSSLNSQPRSKNPLWQLLPFVEKVSSKYTQNFSSILLY